MGKYTNCPVCNVPFIDINRHLIAAHGWRYFDDVPQPPPDNKHVWQATDEGWVCLDKNCGAKAKPTGERIEG